MERIWAAAGEWPIAYKSGDGHVVGMLHIPRGKVAPPPVVLLCHGFTGHRVENHRLFVTLARSLAEAGIAALRIDFRGSGESSGEFSMMTIKTEVEDALNGLAFLREEGRVDSSRLGLLGFSMGGCVAAMTAGQSSDLKAVALWSPVAHPVEQFLGGAARAGVTPTAVVDWGGWPIGADFGLALGECHPVIDIRNASGPVLIIQGSADAVVKPTASEDYAAALLDAARPHKHVVVPGADHIYSSLPWTQTLLDETLAWFRTHLA